MADHEMMNLEEMGSLRDSMELLGEELMNGHRINPNLYVEYDVKRGLRDSAGKGVLTGLTEISDVTGYDLVNGRKIPAHGRLYYQGYNVNDIVDGLKGRKFGFEETIYLYYSEDFLLKKICRCSKTLWKTSRHFQDVLFEMLL